MVTIGIVLGETSIHLSHERIPIHAVTVKDCLIDFFLYIPRLGYADAISVSLGIHTAFLLAQNIRRPTIV